MLINSVAIWLTDFSKLTPEEKECVNYNPLLFPEMKKMAAEESLSVSSLPLGGYEHDFDFDLWEKVKKKQIAMHMCSTPMPVRAMHLPPAQNRQPPTYCPNIRFPI